MTPIFDELLAEARDQLGMDWTPVRPKGLRDKIDMLREYAIACHQLQANPLRIRFGGAVL
jgi:hypothetical protein